MKKFIPAAFRWAGIFIAISPLLFFLSPGSEALSFFGPKFGLFLAGVYMLFTVPVGIVSYIIGFQMKKKIDREESSPTTPSNTVKKQNKKLHSIGIGMILVILPIFWTVFLRLAIEYKLWGDLVHSPTFGTIISLINFFINVGSFVGLILIIIGIVRFFQKELL